MLPPSPRRLILLAGFLILLLITIGSILRTRHNIEKEALTSTPAKLNDFDRWMQRIPHHLNDHADITDERSANTVLDMLLLAPFTHLSRLGAQTAWMLCKPFMVVAIVALTLAMVRNTGRTLSPLCLLLVFIAWVWPVIGDIQEGQTNLFMLTALVLGLWFAQYEQNRRCIWLAGLFIALAIGIKVTPLIFLCYAIWRRRWQLALAIVAGIVFWFLLIPALAFGWQQTCLWQTQWYHVMVTPYARGEVRVVMGESIPSFLTKLLRDVPAFTSDKTGHPVDHFMNVANLPAPLVGWIVRLTLLTLAAIGAWWMRRPLATFRSERFILEIGCVAAFMLWAAQWTLVAHYVTFILPLAAAAMIASDHRYPPRTRRLVLSALCAAALLMLLTSDLAKLIAGPDGREYMLMINVCLIASLLLATAILHATKTPRPKPLTPPRTTSPAS